MLRIARMAFFLIDHAFCSVAASAPFMRLLDLMSREELSASADADTRSAAEIPDLEYCPVAHSGDPVPMHAPRGIRAWHVDWKPSQRTVADGLGYLRTGGFYLPKERSDSPRPGILVLPILHDPLSLASGALARFARSP